MLKIVVQQTVSQSRVSTVNQATLKAAARQARQAGSPVDKRRQMQIDEGARCAAGTCARVEQTQGVRVNRSFCVCFHDVVIGQLTLPNLLGTHNALMYSPRTRDSKSTFQGVSAQEDPSAGLVICTAFAMYTSTAQHEQGDLAKHKQHMCPKSSVSTTRAVGLERLQSWTSRACVYSVSYSSRNLMLLSSKHDAGKVSRVCQNLQVHRRRVCDV